MTGRATVRVILVYASVVLLACSSDAGPRVAEEPSADGGPRNGRVDAPCERSRPPGRARGPSAKARRLTSLSGEVRVDAVVYPHRDVDGARWSQWGQGVVHEDGRFFSAIGDHEGADGNSYFYEYEPRLSQLTLIGDVRSAAGDTSTGWGWGKVHGQLVAGRCGELYATTFWGDAPDRRDAPDYEGDLLLRLDPSSRRITSLGPPVGHHGIPSVAGSLDGRHLYGEAVDAFSDGGAFFVYDVTAQKVVFRDSTASHVGFRNVMVDEDGRAYFAGSDERLNVYDPATNTLRRHEHRLPAGWLRASTRPGPDGTVYGVTRNPEVFFALRPSGRIDRLGAARGYTASVALHPAGDRFFYVPGAHGDSWEQGTPVISVDTATGQQRVLVELNDALERELGLRAAGSYNVAVDPGGDWLYVGLNAGSPSKRRPFGEVVLVAVEL